MCSGDGPEIFRSIDTDKPRETAQIIFVRMPRLRIINIGEPFDRLRHITQLLILGGSQNRDFRFIRNFGKIRILGFWNERIHEFILPLIKYVIMGKKSKKGAIFFVIAGKLSSSKIRAIQQMLTI